MTDTNTPAWKDPDRIGLLAFSFEGRTIRPLQDQVVIELEPLPKRQGGVIIPESAQRKEEMRWARVIAAGPGDFDKHGNRLPMDVMAGDRVLVRGNPGWVIGPYRILRQGAIEAVAEENARERAERILDLPKAGYFVPNRENWPPPIGTSE